MPYKWRKAHKDSDIADIQRQIADSFATRDQVNDKYVKVATIENSQPKASELKDGETKLYYDGTNHYRYYKAGGKLLRQTLTEV